MVRTARGNVAQGRSLLSTAALSINPHFEIQHFAIVRLGGAITKRQS